MQRILGVSQAVLFSDTKQEPDWQTFTGHTHQRSWLCVPLVASQHTLGLLSAGHTQPDQFTREDLRRAQLLAIPAAVAIQNSRLYECASIYGSELEKRIHDLHAAKKALEESEKSRKISEDKFRKVFSSSPVAFSITTVSEGRYLDVNTAYEKRYGYSRADLIGHTVHELQIWENPGDHTLMVGQIQKDAQIRNVIAPLSTKSGQIKITTVCADRIQFDGQACVLAISEDLPQYKQSMTN